MNIGPVAVEPGLALAPMAGVTSHPFRLLAREYGCGLVYSEMISARGLLYGGNRRNFFSLYYTERERPIAFQLFGAEPALLAAAAQKLEAHGADIIDLNLGCPVRKIVRNGEGGALMRNPHLCASIFRAVVEAVRCPVTVKMRKSWDESSPDGAVEIAVLAEAAGVKAVAVHGRTVTQGYSGRADWEIVRQVKKAVKIPVFGNGDVDSPERAEAMLERCGCDGVMIGRAALGSPWIFTRIRARLAGGQAMEPPTPAERVAVAVRHLEMLVHFRGERVAVREMRRHAGWYIKGLPGAAEARRRLVRADGYEEMAGLLREFARQAETKTREV